MDTYIEVELHNQSPIARFSLSKVVFVSPDVSEISLKFHPFGKRFWLLFVGHGERNGRRVDPAWAVASESVLNSMSHCGGISPITPERYYGSNSEFVDQHYGKEPY